MCLHPTAAQIFPCSLCLSPKPLWENSQEKQPQPHQPRGAGRALQHPRHRLTSLRSREMKLRGEIAPFQEKHPPGSIPWSWGGSSIPQAPLGSQSRPQTSPAMPGLSTQPSPRSLISLPHAIPAVSNGNFPWREARVLRKCFKTLLFSPNQASSSSSECSGAPRAE